MNGSPLFIFVIGIFSICAHAHEGHHDYNPNDNDGRGRDTKTQTRRRHPMCLGCSVKPHVLICHEYNLTALWSKSTFVGDEYDVKLLDSACNNFRENKTAVWITADFGACGSTIIEHRNVIIQKNSAFLRVRNITGNIVREHVYKYNLQCVFQRKNNASTAGGYEVIQGIKKTISLATDSAFDISIDVYTSSSFMIKDTPPVTVSMNQPIYIAITKINKNQHFKMIVQQCFATPTPSYTGASYIFFHKKCGQDPSFRIVSFTDNQFNFVITAFKFVRISKAVYIHCRVFICQKNSRSPQCNQECSVQGNQRLRRATKNTRQLANDVFKNVEVKEIQNITTNRINVMVKKTCANLRCPDHSKCVDMYPAVCRCDSGYVFSTTLKICTDQRVMKMQGLGLNKKWVYTYMNGSSFDFLQLATDMESKLKELFPKLGLMDFDGVKVIKAYRKSDMLIDVSLSHGNTSNVEDIFDVLMKLFTHGNVTVLSTFEKVDINTKPLPVLIRDSAIVPKGQGETIDFPLPTQKINQHRKGWKPITKQSSDRLNEKKATVAEQIPVIRNDSRLHEKIILETTPVIKNNSSFSDSMIVYSNKDILLLSIILSISFVVVLCVAALLYHYKRNIYYHVLTW